ncbi:MAG: glycosyltransferase family 4 protein [Proteobacteria bacterium]|nr:glycosyltransferase family 4 protein [Pseudomonadota bacterium]MBU1420412.1 glycosyltransferase family 4 protein [Pseudomonadota bacterium]MBU1456385.1 glycosyltransferase family 4 protein [Pseudomonadota bacterium]
MHIVYDYQIFALQKVGGISRYFVELASRLPASSPEIETTVLAPVHINEYLASSSVRKIGWKVACFPGKHRILPAINRIASRTILKSQHPDIFHETYYSATVQSAHVPHILSVYDMIHERFPHQFQGPDLHIPQLKAKAVARADHVIAISNHTRDDLIQYLNVSPEKITVIPLAASFEKTEKKKDVNVCERPYLLYVGLREGVKNFQRLLLAFAHSTLLLSEFDLLCVGGGEFNSEELRCFQKFGVSERIKHQSADDSLLASLYSHAALFVYPSLYEGFGLPLLEAMHCGCPVACSNTSSMPEIAGDAAIYFDPSDEEEIRVAMESTVQSKDIVTSLRARGHEREKLFSWDKCVSQTLELYRSKV